MRPATQLHVGNGRSARYAASPVQRFRAAGWGSPPARTHTGIYRWTRLRLQTSKRCARARQVNSTRLKPCLDHCVALCVGPPRSGPHPIAALTRGVAGRQRGAQPKPRAGRLGSVRHARASGHSAPRGHAAPGRRATRDPPRQHRGQVWATVGCGVVEPEMRYGFVSSGHWLS